MTWTELVTALVAVLAFDIDGALYLSSMSQAVEKDQQNRLIRWALLIEYVGRLIFIALVVYLLQDDPVLFSLLGLELTLGRVTLLVFGGYLFFTSSVDLGKLLGDAGGGQTAVKPMSLRRAIPEVSAASILLNLDGALAAAAITENLAMIAIILALATLIRWPFIAKLSNYIRREPSLQYVTSTFMVLIAITLILEGVRIEFPEEAFALVLVAAVITQITYKKVTTERAAGAPRS